MRKVIVIFWLILFVCDVALAILFISIKGLFCDAPTGCGVSISDFFVWGSAFIFLVGGIAGFFKISKATNILFYLPLLPLFLHVLIVARMFIG